MSVKQQSLYLKLNALGDQSHTHSICLVEYDIGTKELREIMILTGNLASFRHLPGIGASAMTLKEALKQQRYSGAYMEKPTKDIQGELEDLLRANDNIERQMFEEVLQAHRQERYQQLIYQFKPVLRRALYERQVQISLVTEIIEHDATPELTEEKEDERSTEEKEQVFHYSDPHQKIFDDFFILSHNESLLPAEVHIAPVSGMPIYDLQIGDIIHIQIKAESSEAKDFLSENHLLNENGSTEPVEATVFNIRHHPEVGSMIFVHIKESFYGKIIEKDPVKVQVVNQEAEPAPTASNENTAFILMVTILAVVLALLVIFYRIIF